MKKEDRELLVRDLCGRLPYNTIISVTNDDRNTIQYLVEEDIKDLRSTILYSGNTYKPYLFPLSSMTDELGKELEKIDPEFYSLISENGNIYISMDIRGYDWLNKNHFDYRGLIEKGLALDATGLNIY